MFKKLIREPLLHFLLIGAALFMLSELVNKNQPLAETAFAENKIVIDDSVVADIKNTFFQHNGYQPAPAALQALIQQYITREMLYREALKVGLDKNNDSLKTLLAGQMSVAYEPAEIAEPTDEQLKPLLQDKSWYANDTGMPDTSKSFFQMMKFKLKNRYNQLEKERQKAEKLKQLEKNYTLVRKDHIGE